MAEQTISNPEIISIVLEVINTIFSNIINSIDETVFPLLDRLIFINNDIFSTGAKFNKLLSTSSSNGVLVLANCLFAAFVLYYAGRLIIANLVGLQIESPSKFFIRAFLTGVAMNSALPICKFFINSTNLISSFFCDLGKNIFGKQISFVTLMSLLETSVTSGIDILSLDGILSSILSISAFTLIISFSFRYILIEVLIILSPFAILCLSNSSTEGFFKSWFKCLLSLLILQVVISVMLLIPYSLLNTNNDLLFNKVLLVGSITALLKSNQFVKEFMGGIGIGTNFQSGLAGIRTLISK
jgi:type IV secretory pathway VirB6-like protein